jgi:hypothetical protein
MRVASASNELASNLAAFCETGLMCICSTCSGLAPSGNRSANLTVLVTDSCFGQSLHLYPTDAHWLLDNLYQANNNLALLAYNDISAAHITSDILRLCPVARALIVPSQTG